MTPDQVTRPFWFGTHYFRAPTPPPNEWNDDFHRLASMGLQIIQCRVFWKSYERLEGQYRWDELDRLMDGAADHGLRMAHQIHLENAPHYIFEKYDGYRIDIRGQRIWPIAIGACYQGGWIPCFDVPAVMERGEEFVRRLVERYRTHPAMELWHAWNEPRARPMHECACAHSVLTYQQLLKKQFGTIDSLNDAYGKTWPDFSAVDAARDTSDFAEMHLWRQWATTRIRHRVDRVVAICRELDPQRAVISHVGMNNMQQDPLNDISDDILMHNVADLYGSSFEMRYSPEPIVHSLPFLVCDWMRHVCREKYTIYEVYPSRGRYEPEIPPHQVQQWLFTPPACGACSEFLWQFKKERVGNETNDAGLMEIDGSDNPNSLAAREVFPELSRLGAPMAGGLVPPAKLAILFDLKTDLLGRIEYTTERNADYTGAYRLRTVYADTHPYKAHLQGTYHLFWLNNVKIDMASCDRLEQACQNYRALYLPMLSIIDDRRSKLLLDFVKGGGRLIVDGGFATRSANTWVQPTRPAFPAGYRETLTVIDPALRQTLKLNNLSLPIAVQSTRFDAGDNQVLANWNDGTAAIVQCAIGKGKLLAMGFLPGLSYLVGGQSTAWRAWLDWLMNWTDVPELNQPSGADQNITLRDFQQKNGDVLRYAFRRWGADSATPDDAWTAWPAAASGPLLINQSHVKCARIIQTN